MAWLAGADGCKAGWFRVCRETVTGELRFDVITNAADLARTAPGPKIVTLDIPVGLPDSGSRECDIAARRCLGQRRSSVFPSPVRAALAARTREEASAITTAIDGRGVGAQAWAICSKIREVDVALASDEDLRSTLREVHPELCFWAWNGMEPMKHWKRRKAGKAERSELAERWLGAGIAARARGGLLKKDVGDDDVLDALAALWTAHRIAAGSSKTLPVDPPLDSTGLRMEMVY